MPWADDIINTDPEVEGPSCSEGLGRFEGGAWGDGSLALMGAVIYAKVSKMRMALAQVKAVLRESKSQQAAAAK